MSSQSPLSTLATSHSLPNVSPSRESSHSSSAPSPGLTRSPSIYVTFKVLQLLNTFRKRVKTRVQSRRYPKKATSTRAAEDFCQDFERQAFEEIDRYLGRKNSIYSRKSPYPRSNRRSSIGDDTPLSRQSTTEWSKVATATKPNEAPTSSKSIQWLLDELDKSVKSDAYSLSTVAASDRLFVKHRTEFQIERISLKEITQLLVVVRDLVNTLKATPYSRSGIKTLSEGNELLDFTLDETNTANLEHLLLCLKDQLLRLLVAKLIELVHKHVVKCQRDQNKHVDEWFFTYPDARHPLSTTWPWSIRPSLAVLWGVCWMFYDFHRFLDNEGNMLDEQGRMIATRQQVETFLLHRRQQEGIYPANHFGQVFSPQGSHRAGADPRLPRSLPQSHSPNSENLMTQPLHHRGLTVATSHPSQSQYSSGASDQAAHASAGLAIHGTNNTYTAAPRAYADSAPPADTANWLPQADFTHDVHDLGFQDNAYPADDVGQWSHLPPQSVPEQQPASFGYPGTLPPRPRNPSTPSIRVTTDFSGFPEFHQQPQDPHHSATSISSNSSVPLQESNYYIPYNTAHLSPQTTRNFMHPEQRDMNTPPHSPHSPQALIGEQITRKRSYSEMSGGVQAHPHSAGGSRSGSVTSLHPEHSGEERSPQNRHPVKRGDPPTNTEGKYVCNFSAECGDQTFDRKCEWSKHMDKHDRPYRCGHASCAKLQGFTYSGGLLRHEREVHGKHGGPKAQLMCPHEDCKRHAGKGFTRKENLNEHIRRVHSSNPPTQSQSIPLKREGADVIPGAEDVETPASRISEVDHDDRTSPTHKRRRYNLDASERSASEDVEDLKDQVRRLTSENAEKDSRIMDLDARLRDFEAAMRQLQQQGQGQG